MAATIKLATCSLNQWALDFEGNLRRILQSIRLAKAQGAVFRLGPELEISGYGCNDHFYEIDTFNHSFEILAELLKSEETRDIICDVGMPIMHKSVRYNCRVLFHNKKILFIRPKLHLAMEGNYREARWFTPWVKIREKEDFVLPEVIRNITNQHTIPFGDIVLQLNDTCIGSETCEELFTPNSPHIHMGLDGVEIFTNGSGSHHELRKLNTRIELIQSATAKVGGVYMYANQLGCDGERLYYDGSSLIAMNGKFYAQGSQFSLNEVEVVVACLDLSEVRAKRGYHLSRGAQASNSPDYPRVCLDLSVCTSSFDLTPTQGVRYHSAEEEIALGPACWLWDYLRRSGMGGYFLPLSGGIDSSSTACIVYSMCSLVAEACRLGDPQVIADVQRVVQDASFVPTDAAILAGRLFHTAYLSTENSSEGTRGRAAALASKIGAYHLNVDISSAVHAVERIFAAVTTVAPRFKVNGGSSTENLALQNIQARMRMLLSYMFAQLLPWVRGLPVRGLLVLGSANVDECLRGYLTKYDCSSADLNPIGGISKSDLRAFISYSSKKFNFSILNEIYEAPPTAELEPITETHVQTDEQDMGMSYADLTVYGRLRKINNLGPVGMFTRLRDLWREKFSLEEIGEKVKFFYRMYAINRHKSTVLTPAYHAEGYSPDDHRFDHRQFLYPDFCWQFRQIDEQVSKFIVTRNSLLGGGNLKRSADSSSIQSASKVQAIIASSS